MGAKTVIAINVGDLADKEDINYSILGLAGATIDAMMRANTKQGGHRGGYRPESAARGLWFARLAQE